MARDSAMVAPMLHLAMAMAWNKAIPRALATMAMGYGRFGWVTG